VRGLGRAATGSANRIPKVGGAHSPTQRVEEVPDHSALPALVQGMPRLRMREESAVAVNSERARRGAGLRRVIHRSRRGIGSAEDDNVKEQQQLGIEAEEDAQVYRDDGGRGSGERHAALSVAVVAVCPSRPCPPGVRQGKRYAQWHWCRPHAMLTLCRKLGCRNRERDYRGRGVRRGSWGIYRPPSGGSGQIRHNHRGPFDLGVLLFVHIDKSWSAFTMVSRPTRLLVPTSGNQGWRLCQAPDVARSKQGVGSGTNHQDSGARKEWTRMNQVQHTTRLHSEHTNFGSSANVSHGGAGTVLRLTMMLDTCQT